MWKTLLFSLFGSIVFVLSEKCEKTEDICRPNGPFPAPNTPEELGVFCGQVINFMECSLAIRAKCDPEDGMTTDEVRGLIPIAKQICNNETKLYKDLEASVSCLKGELQGGDTRCFEIFSSKKIAKNFKKQLQREGITDVTSKDPCFRQLFVDTCFLVRIGVSCGTAARDALIDITEMVMGVKEQPCYSRINGKRSTLVKGMDTEYFAAEEFQQFLKKFQNKR